MQKLKTNKALPIICWLIVLMYMGVIFFLSNKTSTESAGESGFVLEMIRNIFGENAFSDFIIRKSAHFIEYAGLSFLLNIAFFATVKKRELFFATSIASIYAITDELHQAFVPGRACQLRDWVIDTSGAVLGMILFLLIIIVINKYNKNKLDSKDKVF